MALSMGRGRMSMLDYIREQEDFGPGGAAEPAVEFGNFFQGNPTYYGTAPGAAAQPGPQGQAVDQYAAIRNLQPVWNPETVTEGDSGAWVNPGSWMLDLNALDGTPFQSKYNSLVPGPDGSMLASYQRPGGHKHETFSVLYRQGPDGRWTMDDSTIENQHEKSGARQFWRAVGEGALVTGAGYLGGNALSAYAAGGGAGAGGGLSGMDLAADGGANALWQTGAPAGGGGLSSGGIESPLTNSPQFQPSPNLPTGAVDPVTMPALPSSPTINPMPGGLSMQEAALGTLPEVAQQQSDIPATDTPAPVTAPSVPGSVPGPGPGLNSPLPSWMPQWLRDNPQLARQVITGMGGLLGAMEGNSGGSAPAAPSYGPAQQWTSGLSMAAQPRPRQQQPALNYNQPAPTGLAMGAGRFLRGG